MYLLQCFHCPLASNRWLVIGGRTDVEDSINAHIVTAHPGTGEWVEEDDWAVLDEPSTVALDEYLTTIQQ